MDGLPSTGIEGEILPRDRLVASSTNLPVPVEIGAIRGVFSSAEQPV